MSNFSETVVAAVTAHMNGDHPEDNLLIVRAFGYPEATASTMTGLTADGGVWAVEDAAGSHEVTVAWPGGTITERPEVRQEVVKLYKAACEKLGVTPREEHAPAEGGHGAHGGHGHGGHGGHGGHHGHGANPHGGHPHAAEADDETGEKPFSRVLREGSWADHSDSEGASFMGDIMRGLATKQDYIDLVIQHYYMYVALEAAAASVADEPAFAGFHTPELDRLPALERDLAFLVGEDWRERIACLPATKAYAARITELQEEGWVAGIVAHHYTRYLGDLSGGQMISRQVVKQHGLGAEGVEFYDFSSLPSLAGFKNDYRAALDRFGAELGEEEKARMLDEVRTAYGFNTAVFVDLGAAKAAAAAN